MATSFEWKNIKQQKIKDVTIAHLLKKQIKQINKQ
jgi:hypothetical protein